VSRVRLRSNLGGWLKRRRERFHHRQTAAKPSAMRASHGGRQHRDLTHAPYIVVRRCIKANPMRHLYFVLGALAFGGVMALA
jgi:hypothetical protein